MPVIRSPSNCHCSLWFPDEYGGRCVLSLPRLRTHPPPHSYGNQRLQRQFDGLLMTGMVMPETCWAVSVRQSNKILRLIVASSWVFYLSDRVLSHVVMKIWRLPSFSIVHMKCCQPNAIPFTVGLVTWPLWVGCPSFYSSLGNWNRRKITFLCTGYV